MNRQNMKPGELEELDHPLGKRPVAVARFVLEPLYALALPRRTVVLTERQVIGLRHSSRLNLVNMLILLEIPNRKTAFSGRPRVGDGR